MLKLPKDVVSDPRHEAVLKILTSDTHPLWEEGTNPIATVPLTPKLIAELRRAFDLSLAVQGIEQISSHLMREQKGLDALKEKAPAQNVRISRILFMANDGATRFYRDCDSALYRYKGRLIGCRIDATGEELGTALYGGPKMVRAILLADKKAVASSLLALVP